MSLTTLIVLVQFIIICILVVLLINKNQIIKAKEGMCKALEKIINDKVKRVGMGEVYVFAPKESDYEVVIKKNVSFNDLFNSPMLLKKYTNQY